MKCPECKVRGMAFANVSWRCCSAVQVGQEQASELSPLPISFFSDFEDSVPYYERGSGFLNASLLVGQTPKYGRYS